jgi:NAD(P)-dependent dehydrogenase (short-subunit alcohol dehydrogenase family)
LEPNLEGKVALITGAGRGIGRAIALAFGRSGARLALCSRTRSELSEVAEVLREQGTEVHCDCFDLRDGDRLREFVAAAGRRLGSVGILVNNASVLGPRAPIADYPIDAWRDVLEINATAPFQLIRLVLPGMIAAGSGSIINVSSSVGRRGRRLWGGYAVSKFALEGLTEVLADELSGHGVRVNSVNPGGTATRMRAQAYPEEDPATLPRPEEIVPVFLFLASDASRRVTGRKFNAREFNPSGRHEVQP